MRLTSKALDALETVLGIRPADPAARLAVAAERVTDAALRAAASRPRAFCAGCIRSEPPPPMDPDHKPTVIGVNQFCDDWADLVARRWREVAGREDLECATARRDGIEGENCRAWKFLHGFFTATETELDSPADAPGQPPTPQGVA